jgi:D-3-phosphoglycerate dehydrogenase
MMTDDQFAQEVTMVPRVLITDRPWENSDVEREVLRPLGAEVIEAPDGEEETLADLACDVDAIATCWANVTERVIAGAARCRIICRMGIGLDNIAIPAATARGIPVTNVPDYCVEEVADHTLALLLAFARNIGFFHLRTKQGAYNLRAASPMRRLSGQTLGLFGLGRIGRRVAEKARGLGLKVIAHTSSGNDHGTGCPMVTLEELLVGSDFVSIHAPLTAATRHVFDAAALARMKPTAVLLNTSRGPLIDPDALRTALRDNRLGGAGLDVFEPEPPDLSDPLYRDERVIVTPHAAFVSEESLLELRTRVARQILACLSGSAPENIVNGVSV